MARGATDLDPRPCVALSGGVGGAKLVLGLSKVMAPEALAVIVNTCDDFEHLGLHISPDLDTLMYTLAGLNNPETGWGRADETGVFMSTLAEIGGETWFYLGDKDLATHVERTRRLAQGDRLTEITADFCAKLGVGVQLLPMSDDSVRTIVETPEGPLAFQHYFVRERCEPKVTGFRFEGAEAAAPSPSALQALANPDLRAVIIGPSNPFISIDPILALPALREAIVETTAPVIAVSPIIGGRAVKGPTAKMMAELGMPSTAPAVARHYADLIDGFVLDLADEAVVGEMEDLGLPTLVTRTLMESLEDRVALARAVLEFADRLRAEGDEDEDA